MFTSLSKTRQRADTAARRHRSGRRLRPLTVESFEGRLMLASDWLDFAPSNIPAASIHLTFDSNYTIPLQALKGIGQAQGGFVSPTVTNGELLGGNLVPSGTGQLTDTTFELFSGGMPRVNYGGNFANWFDFGGIDAANGNIRPVVIPFADPQPDLDLNSPVLAGGGRTQTTRNEGGPIPIESILAKDIPGGGLEDGNRRIVVEHGDEPVKATRLTSDSRDESSPLTRSPTMQSPSPLKVTLDDSKPKNDAQAHAPISGEWARAIVFELAGGEPANILQPAQNGSRLKSVPLDDSTVDTNRPLLNAGAQLEANRGADLTSELRTPASVTKVQRHVQPVTRKDGFTGIAAAQLNAFARGQNWEQGPYDISPLSFVTLIAGNSALSAAHALANGNVPDAANSEVFAQLDESKGASIGTADDENAFGQLYYSAPLLMVLALQQVNAARVRSAKKHSTVLAWPPRSFARKSND
jgi:hypothetical protein